MGCETLDNGVDQSTLLMRHENMCSAQRRSGCWRSRCARWNQGLLLP